MSETIFGYDWETIQRAQQGGRLNRSIDTSKPVTVDPAQLEQDKFLLQKHGLPELKKMQYHGVIDRLTRARII